VAVPSSDLGVHRLRENPFRLLGLEISEDAMKLRAITGLHYGMNDYKIGEIFEAVPFDAMILTHEVSPVAEYVEDDDMKMRAKKPFRYGRQKLKAGEEFDTKTIKHAQILTEQQNAEIIEEPQSEPQPEPEQTEAPPPTSEQPEPQSESAGADSEDGKEVKKKQPRRRGPVGAISTANMQATRGSRRRYARRDMKAEE
jgi:hypothetical protein